MGQQGVLGDLQSNCSHEVVVVPGNDATKLAQLQVGATLGLDGVLHLIYCIYNSCGCNSDVKRNNYVGGASYWQLARR